MVHIYWLRLYSALLQGLALGPSLAITLLNQYWRNSFQVNSCIRMFIGFLSWDCLYDACCHPLVFFLKRIMSDALDEHDGKVSIGGRNITNLLFAIAALAEEEQELEALVQNLDNACTRYDEDQCQEDRTGDKQSQ